MQFDVLPIHAPLSGATAQISVTATPDGWSVMVFIVRKGAQAAIPTSTLQVSAVDAEGQPLILNTQPASPLVEAGGSLQRTASGAFGFVGSAAPRYVEVRWQGDSARFHIVPRE